MVTDVLKVPGNYVVNAESGTITLNSPLTILNGNLTVQGATTTIESINASVKDNIIILNAGETNPYVSAGTAGFLIARGNSNAASSAASLIYDDTITNTFSGNNLQGVWNFGNSVNSLGYVINVGAITVPASYTELTFFGSVNPSSVLSVSGTTDYELQVTDPDHIPNKAYVDALLANTEFSNVLKVGNSTIKINDNSISTSSVYYNATNRIIASLGTGTNDVVLLLTGSTAQFKGITLDNNRVRVTNTATNINLSLEAGPGGIVNMTSGFRFRQSSSVAPAADYTTIYSTSTVGGGGTGLYYANTTQTDELVSRRRSIIYGIIF
jgi:hypothetical protein